MERLAADAPGMERPGSDLIAFYLSASRHPAGNGWSRKHADTQRRLCARYLEPVIGHLACEDIKVSDMQAAVNAAPTAGEGDRVRRCVSALVHAGIAGGYLISPRLRLVHRQPVTAPNHRPWLPSPGSPRCSWTPRRSLPLLTWPGSARPWPPSGSCMS